MANQNHISGYDLFQYLSEEKTKSVDNMTLTENGAITYKSMGDTLVDLNNEVMALRNKEPKEIQEKFQAAYAEDPKAATKWLFHLGDIREGKGERRTFNICMDYMAKQHPEITKELLPLIPEYTRWDYAVRLMQSTSKPVADKAADFVVKQIKKDQSAKRGEQSLLAKWLPSIQTKKPGERKIVFAIENRLGLDHKGYRKMLSRLRQNLNIIEKYMSGKELDKVNMESLTSHQNLKYGKAFQKWIPEKRQEYLEKVMAGEAKMNAGVVYPYEITHAYREKNSQYSWYPVRKYNMDLEALWKMLPDKVNGDSTTLVIRDGSGSMTQRFSSSTSARCLDVATALSVYFAEKQDGPMKDKFITFSSEPEVVDMSHCETLCEKLQLCDQYDDCSNTNIEKTFDLLLDTLKSSNATQEDVPKNLLIVSDMEFDDATSHDFDFYHDESDWTKTLFENIKEKWEDNGYELPRLVFWHINAHRTIAPMVENDRGLVTLSGFSTNTLDMVLSGEFEKEVVNKETGKTEKVTMSPKEQLETILSKPRYDEVEKAYEKGVQKERSYHKAKDIQMDFVYPSEITKKEKNLEKGLEK